MCRRISVFSVGLFVMALGVSVTVKGDLGVSPVSLVPYVYSLVTPLSLGTWTIIANVLMLMGQMLLLKKKFTRKHLLQLPTMFAFGVFIDITLYCLKGISVEGFVEQLLWCVTGAVFVGIGIFLLIRSSVSCMAGEGLVLAIMEIFQFPFSKVKIWMDGSFVVFGAISSLLFFSDARGVGLGTIIAVFLVGLVAGWCGKIFPHFGAWVLHKNEES